MGGTIWCDPMGIGTGCAGVIGADLSPAIQGVNVADFVVPLEQAPDLGGGGGGGFIFDPLAGAGVDPSLLAPTPLPATVDPTLGLAIASAPSSAAGDTQIGAPAILDPTTGQYVFSTTVTPGVDLPTLFNLPTVNVNNPNLIGAPTSYVTQGSPGTVTTPPISVFDPSLLPPVSIPTTPTAGILPPLQPLPPSAAPSVFNRIGQALKNAASGLSGGSAGGAAGGAGTARPPTGTMPTTQAGVLGGLNLWAILVIGGIAYLVFRKE